MTSHRRALLIGINYEGTPSALGGCHNDVAQLSGMLKQHFGYESSDITRLIEKQATRTNILKALSDLVIECERDRVTECWFSFSGHGVGVHDKNADERDKRDECIVTVDHQLIHDDAIHKIIRRLPKYTRMVMVWDCCFSGTGGDLPYRYIYGNKSVLENPEALMRGNIIMISGCRDDQTSADAWGLDKQKKFTGAMSSALRLTLKKYEYDVTVYKLISGMRTYLKDHRFKQVPQITSTQKFSSTSVFCTDVDKKPYLHAHK